MWYLIVSIPDLCNLTYFVVLLFVTNNVNSNVRMAKGRVKSIFIAQCAILMTSLKLTTTSFLKHCRIFISENFIFFVYQVGLKHVEPNMGKIFKTNIILIKKYLIVKSFIFYQK